MILHREEQVTGIRVAPTETSKEMLVLDLTKDGLRWPV